MSSMFSKNRKELAGVKLLFANDVWENIGNTGKVRFKHGLNFFGKIDRKIPNFVMKANNPTAKTAFVDDTSSLPAATKRKIVDFFMNGSNNKKRVVYLVGGDKDLNEKEIINCIGNSCNFSNKPIYWLLCVCWKFNLIGDYEKV